MYSTIKSQGLDIKLWAKPEETESGAIDQLRHVAELPWVFHHVASMADCHSGKGACVGSVVAILWWLFGWSF